MEKNSILHRFYIYQAERFPLNVLIFTTLAVVLSSLAVVAMSSSLIYSHIMEIILAFAAGIIFMFNVRVLDERKDLKFDNEHHKDRPIQRGIVTIKELFTLNFFLLFILFGISFFSSFYAFLFLLVALIYSLIAGMDFFIGKKIREKFFIYNFLCLIQLFFFQIHLYALMTPQVNFLDSLLYIHFLFVILNAGILEVGRKLKVRSNEGTGKDTYSSQIGKKNSVWLFFALIIGTFIVFTYLLLSLTNNLWLLVFGLVSLLIIMYSVIVYIGSESEFSEKFIAFAGILYYLSLHLLIAFTIIF